MRHVIACIIGVFSFGVVLAEKSEYAHWRWWFLAATSDSATIKLYDDVEQKYLTISDLRALREDLEPHYIRLSDTITSASDAQMAALLIRLFHYSTARPYKTAVYTEQIANGLAGFLSGRVDASLSMYQAIDLWTACDLGMNAMLSPDGYEAFLKFQDHQKTIGILHARFQVGGSDSLSRYRCFIQSVDGVTKHLEFNGIRDSAYAAAIVRLLGHFLYEIDTCVRLDTNDRQRFLLSRFSKVLVVRTDDNRNFSAFAESTASGFVYATLLNPQHAPACFPEVRLRSSVSTYFVRRPSTSQDFGALAFNYESYPSFFSVYVESIRPGLSRLFFDIKQMSQMVTQSPITFSNILADSASNKIASFLQLEALKYYSCYNSLYPESTSTSSVNQPQSECEGIVLLNNVMLDRHRELRRAMVLYEMADTQSVISAIRELIPRSLKSNVDQMSTQCFLEWTLGKNRFSFTDDDIAGLNAAMLTLRYSESVDASTNVSPVNASTIVTAARLSLGRSYRNIWATITGKSNRNALMWVFGAMLHQRSRTTSANRELPLPSVDSKASDYKYSTVFGDSLSVWLREIFEVEHLADFVNGSQGLEKSFIGILSRLSGDLSTHQRFKRMEKPIDNVTLSTVWQMQPRTVYLVIDRYVADPSATSWNDASSDIDYDWSIHVVALDTALMLWDIPSELVERSLRNRTTSLSYGLNNSTQLDSIIFKMLDDLRISTGKTYTKLIFLPVDILYSYNPMISHFQGRHLVDEFEVSVSTSLRSGASNTIDSIRLQIIKPGDSDLAYARSESEAICDVVRSRDGVASVLSMIENERDLSRQLEQSNVLHISSHASQANLVSDIEEQPLLKELLRRDDIGTIARSMWGPLVQYKSDTRSSGPLYGDGYISPLEMDVYNVKIPKLVFLSTCQTTTQTSDHWEPPDGLIRVSFSRGADCVVTSPIAVPDRYAASYAVDFYDQLSRTKLPHKAANEIIRQGIREGKSVREYGIYFPIYFSEE